jgi:hypothetical protein
MENPSEKLFGSGDLVSASAGKETRVDLPGGGEFAIAGDN